ncbi:MAG TPA: alpha/beta hydrolase [Acidimicrobiales bacterium]|nr:alpha/beta hydrolase [Acidimicrobiales bacterium]
MPTYESDGLRLHYDVVGSGPPVLGVHGATGTGSFEWAALAGELGDRYRFLIPDLRGHGRSDHRAGQIGIEHVHDDLLALLAREGLAEAHLLAFSFGAEVALDLELRYPGTSSSLVLVSPGLGDPKSSVPTRAQLEAGWPRSLRRLHIERHGEGHWLELMVEVCDHAARRPKADLEALAAIACPILLIVGSKDDPRRVRQARLFEEVHDRCRLIVVEGARHAAHKDRPLEVAAAVGTFLDEVTTTSGPGRA